MKRLGLYVLATLVGFALAAVLASCYSPTPVPPPPGPTPADPFMGAIVQCKSAEVEGESVAALAPVTDCLTGTATSSCLVGLAKTFRVDTIACVVRDAGITANERVLAESPMENTTTVDNAARAWINAERIGYRSAP